jgi:hypothetical protein
VPTKQYQIGKPFAIEELKKPVRARVVSPRDQELEKAITQAEVPVNVGVNAAMFPNAILLSRGVLSNRGRHTK